MMERILKNWAWNFNHKNFNVLAQNRHWNFTKIVSQIVVIFFSKSLPHHRFSRVIIFLHSVRISFIIFFCILNFYVLKMVVALFKTICLMKPNVYFALLFKFVFRDCLRVRLEVFKVSFLHHDPSLNP